MQWEQFLTDHSIEYVTQGPNTKKGEVSVQCPWCGEEDPSQHLGINLTREVWGCHRDGQHRGKSTVRLIQALLGCSVAQAGHLRSQYERSDPDDLSEALALLGSSEEPQGEVDMTVRWPSEFRLPTKGDRFSNYLHSRGFVNIRSLTKRHNLRCATTGRYKDRLIFPLYLNGLIGWTGRAIIDPVSAPRYLASSENVKMTLYGYETPKHSGNLLVLVEGPFDALRINHIAYFGVHAEALMGTSMTPSQLILIRQQAKNFDRVLIMLDAEAEGPAMQVEDAIATSNLRRYTLDPGEDPGNLTNYRLDRAIRWALD